MRRIILGFGVLLALGAAATGAMAAPALEMVERPAILKTCAVVPDQELREIRGCYLDSYIFGLDIKIDLTTPPLPTIAVNFTGKVPPGSKAPTVNNSPVT